MNDIDIMINRIDVISRKIPDFLDCRQKNHKEIYHILERIFGIYKTCINKNVLTMSGVSTLSVAYYSYLLAIFNTDKEIFRDLSVYLESFNEFIINEIEIVQLFESANNITKVINLENEDNN